MTPQQFVVQIHESIVEDGAEPYRLMFAPSRTPPTNPSLQRGRQLFADLSDDQREVFLEILERVAMQTTCSLFAILDGTSHFARGETFDLSNGGQKLNGGLTHIFLQLVKAKEAGNG
jgi:hypothetical protein